jgi:parvulin-like peptidyl-prolyl isomerase
VYQKIVASMIGLLLCVGVVQAEVVDQVLATVDKEAILQSEIMGEIGPKVAEIRKNARNEADFNKAFDKLIQETLDQAIENKILLREALLVGAEIEEDRVDERLQEIKDMYDSQEEFLKELADAGETVGDLRIRIRKQYLARSMAVSKQRQLEKDVIVSEADVAQYYQDNRSQYERPERVRLRQVFLAAGSEKSERAVAKARMEEVQKELDAGADFKALAKAHSEAPGAEDGGIVGWISRGDLVKALEDIAFGLEAGKTSAIVESEGGYHIVLVEKKEEAGLASLDEVRTEIEPLLRRQVATVGFKKWTAELRKRSRVRVFY